MKTKKELIETFFHKVWTEESRETIRKLFVPDQDTDKAWGLKKDEGLTPEDFELFHDCLLKLIKDIRITVDRWAENGDWLFAECTLQARSRLSDSEKPVSMIGCVVVKAKDGKLVAGRNHFDFLNFFEDMGLLPDGTFENCLMGNSLS